VKRPGSIVQKKTDLLAKVAKAEKIAACLHPHLRFGRFGFQIQCLDCPRRWVAAMDNSGVQYDIADFGYSNPKIPEGEFRHSPNEMPRTDPIR
jgi:hypothetical protein